MDHKELTVAQLKRWCREEDFSFATTSDLDPYTGIIGQDRAVKALEFGLAIDKPGYNIYVAGMTGTGKQTYVRNLLKVRARNKPIPSDWVYVHNFVKENQPIALQLPPGMGSVFQLDMEKFVQSLKEELPKIFEGEEYEKQKNALQEVYDEEAEELMSELTEAAAEMGFVLKKTSTGFISLPLKDGETISEEAYEELSEAEKDALDNKSQLIQQKANEVTTKLRRLERKLKEREEQLLKDTTLYVLGHLTAELFETYTEYQEIIDYLDGLQEDILDNIEDFKPQDDEDGANALLLLGRSRKKDPYEHYKVNLMRDSLEIEGAPVVFESNPTYNNLFGRVEFENDMGSVSTDLTRIKPGALHRANGGYIILQLKDVMQNAHVWEALKRVLKTRELKIEAQGEQHGTAMVSLQPEPIPLDVKVILIGSAELYSYLFQVDDDFSRLFKILAEFDDEMPYTTENVALMANFVAGRCSEDALLPFDRSGVARIIEHCSRLADDQNRLTTRFNDIVEVLYEADTWARLDNVALTCGEHVLKAIKEKEYRAGLIEEKLGEMIAENQIMVDTTGSVVGQINGLTILDLGEYSFGKPTRITAQTFVGEEGVVNIEREVRMSGRVHDKGVLILSGYMGANYAQDYPLCLTATICFEQVYEGVDGDSASSTELYALLSSLAEVPIKQSFAVTGSINQKGEIQPVGGVTQKIEGFFKTCAARGLTGEQGVILPYQNIANLVLNDEVVEAVKQGKFHLYASKTIDEGLELLTGIPAAEVHKKVKARLKYFADVLSDEGDGKDK